MQSLIHRTTIGFCFFVSAFTIRFSNQQFGIENGVMYTAGSIEVWLSSMGKKQWMNICTNMIEKYKTPRVLCRMAGYTGGVYDGKYDGIHLSIKGREDKHIWYCYGDEENIELCMRKVYMECSVPSMGIKCFIE